MRDRFPLLVVAALLLFAVAGSYLFQGAKRGRFADQLSTWRSEKDGARALYLLAEESGVNVGRHQTDLEVLKDGASYVLLSVYHPETDTSDSDLFRAVAADGGVADDLELEERSRGMNAFMAPELIEDERKKLLEHVEKGHSVIYVPVGDPSDPLLDTLGVTLVPVEGSEGVRFFVPPQPSLWTYGVARAQSEVKTHLELPERAVPLLIDEQLGGTVAAWVPHGKGEVVVLAAPELAMNKRLAQADNAQLWLSLLGAASRKGPVLFDEYHHGFSDDRSIAEFARRYGLQFAILQLVFGACLWTVALRRFGRPRVPPEEARIGSTDALFAASRLYREGRHHGYAATLIARGLTQDLAQHVGMPARANPAEVAEALRARNEHAVANALNQVSDRAANANSEADVEHAARQAAETRRALHERRKSTSRSNT